MARALWHLIKDTGTVNLVATFAPLVCLDDWEDGFEGWQFSKAANFFHHGPYAVDVELRPQNTVGKGSDGSLQGKKQRGPGLRWGRVTHPKSLLSASTDW
jgi:hypothetical protein